MEWKNFAEITQTIIFCSMTAIFSGFTIPCLAQKIWIFKFLLTIVLFCLKIFWTGCFNSHRWDFLLAPENQCPKWDEILLDLDCLCLESRSCLSGDIWTSRLMFDCKYFNPGISVTWPALLQHLLEGQHWWCQGSWLHFKSLIC